MATSMIDKYRKIMDADPASMVFVELAKALLDQGNLDETIVCCRGGIEHHPDSIVGHVLWGRALIDLGQPDEAMDQFEKAMAIAPNNPYAYNLIGEALLHRRLYRSALPVLARAVELQPGDRRVRQWLGQAEKAVGAGQAGEAVPSESRGETTVAEGASAFVSEDEKTVAHGAPALDFDDEATVAHEAPALGLNDEATMAHGAPALDFDDEATVAHEAPSLDSEPGGQAASFPRTQTGTDASGIDKDSLEVALGHDDELFAAAVAGAPPRDEASVEISSERPDQHVLRSVLDAAESFEMKVDGDESSGSWLEESSDETFNVPQVDDSVFGNESAASENRQFHDTGIERDTSGVAADSAAPDFDENNVLAGMTALFQSLEQSENQDELPYTEERKVLTTLPPHGIDMELPEPTRHPAQEEMPRSDPPADALEEDSELAPVKKEQGVLEIFGLELPPVPGEVEPEVERDSPKDEEESEADTSVADAIAADYEQKLREELIAKESKPTGHPLKRLLVASGVVGGLVLVTALVAFVWSTVTGREEAIQAGLDAAGNGIARDTYSGYLAALDRLSEVLRRDDTNPTARALTASTEAILFSGLDPDPSRQVRAVSLLEDPTLAEEHPDIVLDARHHLAGDDGRLEIGEMVLEALETREDNATLHYLAGLHHLAKEDTTAATEHFSKALDSQPGHARTVLALGNHFAKLERWQEALTYYDNARVNYPGHGRAEVGAARARLALDREVEESLETITQFESVHGENLAKLEQLELQIVAARLQHRVGYTAAAVARLRGAMMTHPREARLPTLLAKIHMDGNELSNVLEAVEKAQQLAGENDTLRRIKTDAFLAWSRYEEAAAVLASLEEPDPRSWLKRAIVAYHAGEYEAARQALDNTRNEEGQMLADAAIYLALVDLATDQPRTSRVVLTRAAQARGADVLVEWALGRWHMNQGNERPTRHHLGNAVEQNPRHYRSRTDMAAFERSREAHDQALLHLNAALEANPYFREALQLLGDTHLALKEPDSARSAYERVLLHHSNDYHAHRGLAHALLELGNLDAAETHSRAAAEHAPREPGGHHALGLVLHAKGDHEQARLALVQARRRNPDDVAILTDLAKVHMDRGQPADRRHARRYLEQALEKDEGNPDARWRLRSVYLEQGEIRDAIQSLNTAVTLVRAQRDEEKLARVKLDLSRAHLAGGGRGGIQQARGTAIRSVQTRDSAEGRELLGRIYLEEKRPVLARQQLEQAIALDPGLPMSHFYLGRILVEAGETEAGRRALEQALSLAPRGGHVREARRILEGLN